ncbi:hypothetical protein Maes01_02690 [Microbulbifer aestuariivivens]|uniref:PepSY domain-containing protein n=2 Tax=Microbulbifer aestuariivivens TaxID=1908308 RepID=A0ABP9WSB3_9GAMM
MMVPMVGWAITGVVFFIKPGYAGAYEILNPKTYPLESDYSISMDDLWEEVRVIKSILGVHVLARSNGDYWNLNPGTLEPSEIPDKQRLKLLFEDAVSRNSARYGAIERIENLTAYTSTGIEVELNWDRLTFNQQGFDRKIIDSLYRIHYLQWTPWSAVNQLMGFVGLLLLMALMVFGVRIYFSGRGAVNNSCD